MKLEVETWFEEIFNSSEKKSKQRGIPDVKVLNHEEDRTKLESELEFLEKNIRLLKNN